jgi:hypothetical protein
MTLALVEEGVRRGRGKSAKSLRLVEAAREILEEIQPASVRAVCYRLFVAQVIKDMSKDSTNAVSRQLVWARENDLIPWEWIVDETREAERIASWDNPEEIISAAVKQYRKNYWQMQDCRVEVWSEKGTLRGTLAPVLNEYGITFRVMHGYGSATAIREAAQETFASDKPVTVFYVGDWDPSGLHISEVDLPERLTRYGGSIRLKRIALGADDTALGSKLPSFEAKTKAKDPRYQWFVSRYGKRCWEVDALSPVVLRQRTTDAITDMLDIDVWNHAVSIEKAERDSMEEILSAWPGISGQASKYSGGLP